MLYFPFLNRYSIFERIDIMWKLGLGDAWVALAFWANIIAVLTCVVYGILCWNRSDEDEGESK